MRTRIAMCLVAGVSVMVALPVPAGAQISDSGNAAQVQYPDMPTREPDPAPAAAAPVPASSPAPAAEESDLPVTGFVAIPLLITGALMLLAGGVMHVRTRRDG
ncbi:MAG: hypothetical protein QOJ22_1228 [Thermoleophilaceae bacterium]|nr:hypothetical protein [Thermoleophilaceae bacterium]